MSGTIEDLADLSDSDGIDEDYCPSGGDESEDLPESDNEGLEDKSSDDECGKKHKSRKKKQKKKILRRTLNQSSDEEQIKEETKEVSKEEEKKHADSLWADFLQDVGSVPIKTCLKVSSVLQKTNSEGNASSNVKPTCSSKPSNSKVTVTEEYEFAGEKILVTKEITKNSNDSKAAAEALNSNAKSSVENAPKSESTTPSPIFGGIKKTSGLDSILGKITGTKRINTLEKSLLDWKKFKSDEGIDEELQQHNRGKDGYLERQAFLERTDHRQFDIERNLRMTNRNKR